MVSFCEEDYAITRYLAEFINALTNFAYGMYVRPKGFLAAWH